MRHGLDRRLLGTPFTNLRHADPKATSPTSDHFSEYNVSFTLVIGKSQIPLVGL